MKLRIEEKQKAIELRIQGKSYKQIINAIPNLSKSTLSGWLKYVKLTPEQTKRLENNLKKVIYTARVKSGWTRKERKRIEIKKSINEAKKELPCLLKSPLFLMGVCLYWAEGSKTQESIQFSNSDPRLIKIMIKWFRLVCKVPKKKIKVRIYIHKVYKNENCEDFWSKIVGLPIQKLAKTTYKPTRHKIKKNNDYKGVCRIEINDVNLFRRIMGWQQGIFEAFDK